jgi:hypothetical protein
MPFALSNDLANTFLVQPNGQIIVGGEETATPSGSLQQFELVLVRLNTDGTTDTSFGTGSYTFEVQVSDGTLTTTSTVSVTVGQTLTSLNMTPQRATYDPAGNHVPALCCRPRPVRQCPFDAADDQLVGR